MVEIANRAIEEASGIENMPTISIDLKTGKGMNKLQEFFAHTLSDNAETSTPEGDALSYYMKAEFHMLSGQYKEALGCYEKATELDPRLGDAYVKKGCINLFLGNIESARKDFEYAKPLIPEITALLHKFQVI